MFGNNNNNKNSTIGISLNVFDILNLSNIFGSLSAQYGATRLSPTVCLAAMVTDGPKIQMAAPPHKPPTENPIKFTDGLFQSSNWYAGNNQLVLMCFHVTTGKAIFIPAFAK